MIRALGLATALAASPAAAQEGAADISGTWAFRADIGLGCTFNGEARLTRPSEKGAPYGCELTAEQICTAPDDTIVIDFVVRQTCVAERSGDRLEIVSTIDTFVRGAPTPAYFPDDFTLAIKSGERMSGFLISGQSADPAEFYRPNGAVS